MTTNKSNVMSQYVGMKNHEVFCAISQKMQAQQPVDAKEAAFCNWYSDQLLKGSDISKQNYEQKDGEGWLRRTFGWIAQKATAVWNALKSFYRWLLAQASKSLGWIGGLFSRKPKASEETKKSGPVVIDIKAQAVA
jgi:hypothetical protein